MKNNEEEIEEKDEIADEIKEIMKGNTMEEDGLLIDQEILDDVDEDKVTPTHETDDGSATGDDF